jgi:hypothetical protein
LNKIGRSKIRISMICYCASILVFVMIYISGVYLKPGNEMGYCLLSFYLIMPLSTFIVAFIISMNRGYLFWFYPIFFGFFGEFIPYQIFRSFDFIGLFFAFIPAVLGIMLGLIKKTNA